MMALSNQEYKKIFLDKWYHIVTKDKKSTQDLFSCVNFILQVHGVFNKSSGHCLY
jgi:hypothetical protein